MERFTINERADWKEKAKEYGFDFYDTVYGTDCWNESAYYSFTMAQVDVIEGATKTLHDMCIKLVKEIANSPAIMKKMEIPEFLHPMIKRSVQPNHLYGRFDLAFTGDNDPKMLEYNADTPTALFESAVWQWVWLEDLIANKTFSAEMDQFNSIHDKIKDRWKALVPQGKTIHFTAMGEFEEDRGTVRYLEDTAVQAGYETQFVGIDGIGIANNIMYDMGDYPINHIFKLYPWEWLAADEFGKNIPKLETNWIEPVWKMILSNKAILPLLWERYPDHPNLLPAFFEEEGTFELNGSFVKKPFLSREGANITMVKDKKVIGNIEGAYGTGGYIKQGIAEIPLFDNFDKYAVIGSWVVGDEPAGMIIRESSEMITNNWSQLVPHVIKG